MQYPLIKQHDSKDCGAACLSMIANYYGASYPIAKFRELIKVDNEGANIYGIVKGSHKIGLDAEALEGNIDELNEGIDSDEIKFPFIARVVNEFMMEHFIVIYGIKHEKFIVGDPSKDKIILINKNIFAEIWEGQIITFVVNNNFTKVKRSKNVLTKYFKYVFVQKKFLICILLCSLLITSINIMGSVVYQYVLESILVSPDEYEANIIEDDTHGNETIFMQTMENFESKLNIIFNNLDTVCIAVIIMYFFKALMETLRGYFFAIIGKNVDVPLTTDYYNHLVELPMQFLRTRKTGEYMSRFYDTGKIRDAVSTATLTVIMDTIMAVACGVVLYFISGTLLCITLVVVIIYGIIIFVFKNPINKINHEWMENEAHVTSYLKESLEGIETIKSNCYEEMSKNKTLHLYDKFANRNVVASVLYNTQDVLVRTTESISIIVMLWVGSYLCLNNIITLSDLFIFYYLISFFLEPMKNLINLQPQLQTALVAAERLNDIFEAQKDNKNGHDITSLSGDIDITDLKFRYGYRDLVLDNINMKFKKGSKTAIIGESGSGKTTITKLLMRFYEPESGSININGININNFSLKSLREKVSYVSQDTFFFSDNIYENLRMGNENISEEEIIKMCKYCYADEFIEKLPFGYYTVLEENASNLSNGQKQRLAIARALLKKPDILILDEATSNLDSLTEHSISKTINEISSNITCIIIAHRLYTIKNSDYIYVLKNGKIEEEGTHSKLMEQEGLYRNFWRENESCL